MTTPNIQLLQSQRLTDNVNGGGQMTNTVIPDNQADNLFSPISRINRSNGNVSLRKAFAMARTADTAQYLGAHAIITAPPSNPGVSALMFATDNWTDLRADASNAIESFLVQGPQTRLWPYGTQVIGQRSIICYQPTTEPLPSIGDIYVIVNTSVTPNVTQFLRITSIDQRVQTFTDTIGNYQLNVITLGISAPLTATYPGAIAQRYSTPPPPSLLCTTNVADAAVYYGVQTLAADVASGAEEVTLTSVFGQLLPSTQGEVPITDAMPMGSSSVIATASSVVTLFAGERFYFFGGQIHLQSPAVEGSVTVNKYNILCTDDGAGNIPGFGTIDYAMGIISSTYNGTMNVTYLPGTLISQSNYTTQQPVAEATRGYIYTQAMTPLPGPKTVTVSYRSLGRWYDLTDDGSGTLIGMSGAGHGAVRFDSGACSITLGALPDIGSSIVFSWAGSSQFDIRTGDVNIQIPAAILTLTHPAKPSSVSVTWLLAGVTKTVTDNGAGVLSGDGTGTINYGAGLINLRPNLLPDPTTGFSVAYQINPATTTIFNPTKSGSTISITLPNAPIAPHSVSLEYSLPIPADYPTSIGFSAGGLAMTVHDDGAGNLWSNYGVISGGTIDYSTGVVTFDPDVSAVATTTPIYTTQNYWDVDLSTTPWSWVLKSYSQLTGWNQTVVTAAFVSSSAVTATATAASATNTPQSDAFPTPPVTLDLTPTTVEPVVPGSVMFAFGGDTYVDRAGSLYRSISITTGAGTLAGSINYQTGIALLTSWNSGAAPSITINALLCEMGLLPIGALMSRVPGQSLRPASFYIQANRSSDSALISATADTNGNWSTADMTGHVDVTTGFYSVQFGQSVLDSSLTSGDKAQPWYNSANVDGTGHIWRPNEAIPGTINYSCVVLTFLPLSESVLGLDPVRLPLDGRVQIFRPGNTLVFRNPLVYSVGTTPTAASTITLPRGNLDSAILFDANAVQVDQGQYTVNLTTGIITMSPATGAVAPQANFDLSAYTAPYTVTHAVADMVLCTDVEITGQISFSPALANAYPAASSFVSSALVADNAGNLQAGYDTLFAQTTWNFNPVTPWTDAIQGSAPTSKYDDIDYPIQVLDHDCITQRWALIFTSATGGNIASENLGVIGTFITNGSSPSANVAPLNPATNNPYFVMDYRGFGTGWASGNAIRFNTEGAGFPIWFVRSVQVGTVGTTDDSFTTALRWDE